ncbi:MAG: MucBP domain-containing protein, partial [Ruminococcus flavefaciens]|nr:MucBP domain-containing protein [Ruminococcus flavefaciens]
NEIDPKQTKELKATVQYSYGGEINEGDTIKLSKTVHVFEGDTITIDRNAVKDIEPYGYKLASVTLNNSEIEKVPDTLKDGDKVVYHYEIDEEQTRETSISIQYYKDDSFDGSVSWSSTVQVLSHEISTNGIPDKADKYDGYKLSKIVVDNEEFQELPETITENSMVKFYYVLDDGLTKTLSAEIKYITEDIYGNSATETEHYKKEVPIVDYSGEIDRNDIPSKEYYGYEIKEYYIGVSKYTPKTWGNARIPDGGTVTIYYKPALSLQAAWSAAIQYECEKTIKEEEKLEETGAYWDFVDGQIGLFTKDIEIKEYPGYKLSNITINDKVVAKLPEALQDKDVVVFHYEAVKSSVTVKYIDEDGEEIFDTEVISGTYGEECKIESKEKEGYELVSLPDNIPDTFGENNITVEYQYAKKKTIINVKYVDEETKEEIEGYGYQTFVYYGNTYATEQKNITGYQYAYDSSNTSGSYSEGEIEVIYYYIRPEFTITVNHIFNDDPDLNDTKSYALKSGEQYKENPMEITGHYCTNTEGAASGIVTGDITITFYYNAVDATVTVSYINQANGKPVIDEQEIITGKYGQEYQTAAKEIPGYTCIGNDGLTKGSFGTSNIDVIYFYEANPATLTIKYVDTEGKEITGQGETITGYRFDDEYNIEHKDITGYTFKNVSGESEPASGKINGTEVTVIFVYEANPVTVTVKHQDEAGNKLAEDKTVTGRYNGYYTTSEESIDGYKLKETPANASGTASDESIEVIYVYVLDNGQTKELSATVKYSLAGEEQKDDKETVTKSVQVLSSETAISTKSIHEKSYEGWGLDYITINDEKLTALPDTVKDKDVITFVYKKADASVTIRYTDEAGEEIKEPETVIGKYGDKYETEAEEIEGYDLKESPANAKGTMGSIGITVTYVYVPKTVTITVKHVDTEGRKIAEPDTLTKKYKEEYGTSAVTVKGYKLQSIPENANGITPADDFEVSYVYAVDEGQTKILTAAVQYSLGGEIRNSDTVTLKKTVQVLEAGAEISTKDVLQKEYAGWEFKNITINGKEVQSLPDTVNAGDVIVYHYGKVSTEPEMPDSITVMVKYVDADGRELAAPKTINVNAGDSYQTEAIELDGYKPVSDSGNSKGTAGSENIEVIYTYESEDATVVINYADETGKQVSASETIKGKYGDKYETKAKEIAGYELASDSG